MFLDVYEYSFVFIPMKKFLFSVFNVYVFITMVLFYC